MRLRNWDWKKKHSYYTKDHEDIWRARKALEEMAPEDGDVDGIEKEFCIGTIEVVKISSEKCVLFW